MANEISANIVININSGNLSWTNSVTTFQIDMTNARGPTPGYLSISTSGTSIDLGELTTPAIGVVTNLDDTNYIDVGPYVGGTFYPTFEVGPGESYPFKVSRNYTALRLRANTAACGARIEVFDA